MLCMRLKGKRRARGIFLLCMLAVVLALARVSQLYVQHLVRSLVPTLLAQTEQRLKRQIRYTRLDTGQQGRLVVEGLRVSRGATFDAGALAEIRKVEVRYDPSLLDLPALLTRGKWGNLQAKVHVEGVRVREPVPLPGHEILSSRTLDTELDLAPALRGEDVVSSIPLVRLDGYVLHLVRTPDKKWNVERLLKRDGQPLTFRGEVRGTRGTLNVTDYNPHALPAPARNQVAADFTARFAGYPVVHFTASGKASGPQAATFEVRGHQDQKTHRWFVTLAADTDNGPYWYRYLSKPSPDFQLLRGRARANVTVWGDGLDEKNDRFRLILDGTQGEAKIASLPQPVRSFSGRLLIDADTVSLSGRAESAGVPFRLAGQITGGKSDRAVWRLDTDQLSAAGITRLAGRELLPKGLRLPPVFSASVYLTGAEERWSFRGTSRLSQLGYPNAAARDIQLTFRGRAETGKNPAITGTAIVARAEFRHLQATRVAANFTLRDQVLQAAAQMQALGGSASARGWADLSTEKPQLYLSGQVKGVQIARLNRLPEWPKDLQAAGTATATFTATGALEAPLVTASVKGTDLRIGEEHLDSVVGNVQVSGGNLNISEAIVQDRRGNVRLSGTVGEKGELHLQAVSRGLGLETLLAGRTEEPVRGRAWLSALVTGTWKEPQAEGKVQVYQPAFGRYEADYLETAFSANRDVVNLSALELRRGTATVRAPQLALNQAADISGAVAARAWHVEGDLTLDGLPLTRALVLAGVPETDLQSNPVAGDLESLRVHLTGQLPSPTVEFEAALRNAGAAGLDLGQVTAAGALDLREGRLQLTKAETVSSLGQAELSGEVRFDPMAEPKELAKQARADLQFRARDLGLLSLVRNYAPALLDYAYLNGKVAEVSGRFQGNGEAPLVTVNQVRVTDLQVNGVAVELAPFSARWSPSGATVKGLQVGLGGGTLELPAVALAGESMPARPVAERVAGRLQVKAIPVPVLARLLEGSPYLRQGGGARLRNFLAEWGIPTRGVLNAEVSTGSKDAPLPADPEMLLARVAAGGRPARLEGSFQVTDLSLPEDWKQPPTQASGVFAYQDRTLTVPGFRVEQPGGVSIRLAGSYQMLEKGGRLDLTTQAREVDLARLAALPVPGLDTFLAQYGPVRGTATLEATVRGSTAEPEVRFTASAEKGEIAGLGLARLSVVDGEYSGAARRLRIGKAEAFLAGDTETPNLRLQGTMPVAWEKSKTTAPVLAAPYDLKLEVLRLPLETAEAINNAPLRRKLLEIQPFSGTIAGTLQVSGPGAAPEATFAVVVENPVIQGVPLDRITLDGGTYSAQKQLLHLGRIEVRKEGGKDLGAASVRISGDLPVQWPDMTLSTSRPRDLMIELPEQPLGVLNLLADDAAQVAGRLNQDAPGAVEQLRKLFQSLVVTDGQMKGNIRLAGSIDAPRNQGLFQLTSKVLKIRGLRDEPRNGRSGSPQPEGHEERLPSPLQTEVRDLIAEIALRGDTLEVSQFTGKSSQGGEFHGSGRLVLGREGDRRGPRVSLNFALERFRVVEKQVGRLLGEPFRGTELRGSLSTVNPGVPSIARPISITGIWPNLAVAGGVMLDDASLPIPFTTEVNEEPSTLPASVRLNLRLLTGKNVWVRNPLARMRLSGALQVANNLQSPTVTGPLTVSDGTFTLPLIQLRNAEGTIQVSYDRRTDGLGVPQPPVFVDLTASSTLRVQRAAAVEAEYYDTTFHIRGAPGGTGDAGIRAVGLDSGLALGAEGGLTVTVRTDPPLPSREIEALIRQQLGVEGFNDSGSNVVETLRGQIEQAFAVNVASAFTGRVEDTVRSALGLDIFSVDLGVTQPLRVRLGKRIFGPLYGTVSQEFGNSDVGLQRRFEVYYRVTPQLRIGVRQEDPLNRRTFFFSGTASF